MTSPERQTHELDPDAALEAILDDPLKPLALGILAETVEPMTALSIVSNINEVLEDSYDAETEFGIELLGADDDKHILTACEDMEVAGLVTIDRTEAEPLIRITEFGMQVGLPIAGVAAGWQLDHGHALFKALFRTKRQLRFSILELVVLGAAGTVIKIAEMLALHTHEIEQEIQALRRAGIIQYPQLACKPSGHTTAAPASSPAAASRGPNTASSAPTIPKSVVIAAGQSAIATATGSKPQPQIGGSMGSTVPAVSFKNHASSSSASEHSDLAPPIVSESQRSDYQPAAKTSETDDENTLTIAPEHLYAISMLVRDMRDVLDGKMAATERARGQAMGIAREPGLVRRLWRMRKRPPKPNPSPAPMQPQAPPSSGGGYSTIDEVIMDLTCAVNYIESEFQDNCNARLIQAHEFLEEAIGHIADAIMAANSIKSDTVEYASTQQASNDLTKLLGDFMLHRTAVAEYMEQTSRQGKFPTKIRAIIADL